MLTNLGCRRMARVPIESEVTGNVWKIEKNVGDQVASGDVVMILESMKMEIPVEAPRAGSLVEICVQPNTPVQEGQVVAFLES